MYIYIYIYIYILSIYIYNNFYVILQYFILWTLGFRCVQLPYGTLHIMLSQLIFLATVHNIIYILYIFTVALVVLLLAVYMYIAILATSYNFGLYVINFRIPVMISIPNICIAMYLDIRYQLAYQPCLSFLLLKKIEESTILSYC